MKKAVAKVSKKATVKKVSAPKSNLQSLEWVLFFTLILFFVVLVSKLA